MVYGGARERYGLRAAKRWYAMLDSIPIFIGYDKSESVAHYTLIHSISSRASRPVEFHPLVLDHLRHIYYRKREKVQSTDFSFTRFLVPYLRKYNGWAIFMDSDMLFTTDIAKLWCLRDDRYDIMLVKHSQPVQEYRKMLGQQQTKYERKNWTSLMLMNCARLRTLSLDYVNNVDAYCLRNLMWVDDDKIGEIPETWNHLSGYGSDDKIPNNVHFTLGGPWWDHYKTCAYSDLWRSEFESMIHADQIDT